MDDEDTHKKPNVQIELKAVINTTDERSLQ